jgi:micrococcal nuclease
MKRFYYTAISAIIINLIFITSLASAAAPAKVRVTKVHDGDTVSIKMSSFSRLSFKIERVRLIGIDAPELKQEPWGRISKRYLKKLISESDWVVSLEFDLEQRDKYGRILGYLWDKKGKMINERMIESGYALLYTFPPNVKYVESFTAAQKRAQSRKTGIWAKGGLKKDPEQWRKEHPRH